MQLRAADIVEPVGEVLVVVDDAVVPVARGERLSGAPVVAGGAAEADELGRADLDRVRVDEPRVVRGRDREREPHLEVLLQPRRGRLRPEAPRLPRRGGHRRRRGGRGSRRLRRLRRPRRRDDVRRRRSRGRRRVARAPVPRAVVVGRRARSPGGGAPREVELA